MWRTYMSKQSYKHARTCHIWTQQIILVERGISRGFFIKRLVECRVLYSVSEGSIAFMFFLFLIFWMKHFYDCQSWEKVNSSIQYTLNEKTLIMLLSFFPKKYLQINFDFPWKRLIYFSFSNLFSRYNTMFFSLLWE